MSDAAPSPAISPDILDTPEAGERLIRGSGMRMAAYAAGLLVGLASVPLVVRHLAFDYGHFISVTQLIFVVAALTEGGLANIGVREFSTTDDATRRALMRNLLGLRIVLTVLGGAAAVGFALLAGYERTLVHGTIIAAAGLLVTNLQYTVTVPLTARMRIGWVAVNDFVAQAATAALMVLLVAAGASLLPFFGVTGVAMGIVLAMTVVLVRGDISLRPSFDLPAWRRLLSDTIVYSAATALGVVYFRVAVLAMSVIASARETSFYGVAFRILDLVNGIPWMLVASAFPILARAARDDEERLRYALQRLFEMGLVLGGLFTVGLVCGAELAVDVVAGPKFEPSIEVLRILAAGVAATWLIAIWAFALLSLHAHRELIVVNAFVLALAIALSAILIPAHGANGGAVTTMVVEIVMAIAYAVALTRTRPDLRPRLTVVPRVAAATALGLAAGLPLLSNSLLATVVAGAVFVIVLAALRAIPPELSAALLRRRQV